PSAPPVHDELGNVRAMRLIRGPRWMHLHGPDNALVIARDEKHGPLARGRDGVAPPRFRSIERERCEKAHRRAGVHGIDQQPREILIVGVRNRRDQLFDSVHREPYRLSASLSCWTIAA